MDYCSIEEMEALAHEPQAFDLEAAGSMITAASRLFDSLCEVEDDFFAAASNPAVYTTDDFIGDGTAYLKLRPFVALNPTDPVKINEGTIDDPDYLVTNVPSYAIRGDTLVVLSKTVRQSPFIISFSNERFAGWPDGSQIRVSANWGWVDVPSAVKQAVAQMVIYGFRTGDPTLTAIAGAENERNQNEYPPMVVKTIDAFKARFSQRMIFA